MLDTFGVGEGVKRIPTGIIVILVIEAASFRKAPDQESGVPDPVTPAPSASLHSLQSKVAGPAVAERVLCEERGSAAAEDPHG